MMIFRILCGEWIEPLWDCMRAEEKVNNDEMEYKNLCNLIYVNAKGYRLLMV